MSGSTGTGSTPWISGSTNSSTAGTGETVILPDVPELQILIPQQTIDSPTMPLAPTPSIPSLPSTTATTAMMGIEQENKPVK